MSGGMLLLTIAAILIYCGLLQRVLDRMRLTDKQTLCLIGAMMIGTLLPNITVGAISVNIGGALIPVGVCIYLFCKAEHAFERWRTLIGMIVTGAIIYGISTMFPDEAETMPFDPIWLYGACGGVVAWLIGRSRRGAFICGVCGVFLADIASAVVAYAQGYMGNLTLGGGGIADAAVISGVVGVLLCETLGEAVERIVRVMSKRRART